VLNTDRETIPWRMLEIQMTKMKSQYWPPDEQMPSVDEFVVVTEIQNIQNLHLYLSTSYPLKRVHNWNSLCVPV
jgi:hypothetical protein